MLKYTAQLSDEFRRASSLSSLQAYQRVKSKTKANIPNYQELGNPAIFQQFKRMNLENNVKLNLGMNRNYENNIGYKPSQGYNTVIVPQSNKNNYQDAQYVTCPNSQKQENGQFFNRKFNTPDRNFYSHSHHKLERTHNTQSTRIQNSNEKTKPSMPIRIQQPNISPSLNLLSNHQIKLAKDQNTQYHSLTMKPNIDYPFGKNPINKMSKLKQNKDVYTKMRISSINNLQNIQRRIQATLGSQRTLKI